MLIIPYNLCKRRNTTALARPVALLPPPYSKPSLPTSFFIEPKTGLEVSFIIKRLKNIKSTGTIYIFCRFCQTNC